MTSLRTITGLQPTGSIHLGNYFGAVKPFVERLDDQHDDAIFIADYHAITAGFSPSGLARDIKQLVATLIACGADRALLFQQSAVPQHTELAWVLQGTSARFGWMNRMVQFKDKMEGLAANSEGPSVGLFTYPVLQAADILLYRTSEVPVGEDQKQHLELTRDIAEKFNREFGDTFRVPKPLITQTGGRLMSLHDASKKMSKSDPDDMSRINLLDPIDLVARKIKRATSDSALIPATLAEIKERPELTNLLTLYALSAQTSLEEALARFAGQGYGKLKPALTEALVAFLEPIQTRFDEVEGDVDRILSFNNQDMRERADIMMTEVKQKIGVLL